MPLVPLMTTLLDSGTRLSITHFNANAFANSILSTTMTGKPRASARSNASSLGVSVIRQATFLSLAISTPFPLIQCLITISPSTASLRVSKIPVNPFGDLYSFEPWILPSTALASSSIVKVFFEAMESANSFKK